MVKKGTEGVEFDDKLNIVNRNIFTKSIGDSFSVASFEKYLVANKVDTLYIVGADAAEGTQICTTIKIHGFWRLFQNETAYQTRFNACLVGCN